MSFEVGNIALCGLVQATRCKLRHYFSLPDQLEVNLRFRCNREVYDCLLIGTLLDFQLPTIRDRQGTMHTGAGGQIAVVEPANAQAYL